MQITGRHEDYAVDAVSAWCIQGTADVYPGVSNKCLCFGDQTACKGSDCTRMGPKSWYTQSCTDCRCTRAASGVEGEEVQAALASLSVHSVTFADIELWAMITTGKINGFSKFFKDTVNASDLFPEMEELKFWTCKTTATGNNPFQIFQYIEADTKNLFKTNTMGDCTASSSSDEYDPLCGICKQQNDAFDVVLRTANVSADQLVGNPAGVYGYPIIGQTQPMWDAFDAVLSCNIDQFGVGSFDVNVLPNSFWGVDGGWNLITSISMLIQTRQDRKFLELLPTDYTTPLLAKGFPDFLSDLSVASEDKHDYFGLDYVQSFALHASSLLRGAVYQCVLWQQSRVGATGVLLPYLGHRLENDCFDLLSQSHDTFCLAVAQVWKGDAQQVLLRSTTIADKPSEYRFVNKDGTFNGSPENLCLDVREWPQLQDPTADYQCGTCKQVVAGSKSMSCDSYCWSFGHECFSATVNLNADCTSNQNWGRWMNGSWVAEKNVHGHHDWKKCQTPIDHNMVCGCRNGRDLR